MQNIDILAVLFFNFNSVSYPFICHGRFLIDDKVSEEKTDNHIYSQ